MATTAATHIMYFVDIFATNSYVHGRLQNDCLPGEGTFAKQRATPSSGLRCARTYTKLHEHLPVHHDTTMPGASPKLNNLARYELFTHWPWAAHAGQYPKLKEFDQASFPRKPALGVGLFHHLSDYPACCADRCLANARRPATTFAEYTQKTRHGLRKQGRTRDGRTRQETPVCRPEQLLRHEPSLKLKPKWCPDVHTKSKAPYQCEQHPQPVIN